MTPTRRYAEGTRVTVESSRGEITGILAKHGVKRMGWMGDEAADELMFELGGGSYRFRIERPSAASMLARDGGQYTYPANVDWHAKADAEWRRRWRANVLLLKAKLEFIESGDTTLDRELLPYRILKGGQTLEQMIAAGGLPMLAADARGRCVVTAHIAVRDGLHACYSVTDTGRGRHYHGCEHATPRDAITHSDALDAASHEEPRQSVSPAERDATSAIYSVTSAGTLREAPHELAEVIGGERGHGAHAGSVALAAGPALSPHPGQPSSARESAGRPPVAPVCRAGVRDGKRERRARVAHLPLRLGL